MIIRREETSDRSGVYSVHSAAFQRLDEANLVDVLREEAESVLSLVAEDDGDIVGHIMFSPVMLTSHPDCKVMGLGPMAVFPERQRTGIGSLLVATGVKECQKIGIGAVVVLGHSEYYPRFGFLPASRYALNCEYDVPDEVFMAVELIPGYLRSISGTAVYHDAFRNV